jgi:hypothetical protein
MVDTNILQSIKKNLGIVQECTDFDQQVLSYINSACSILHQLGVGPEEGIDVDEDTEWSVIVTQPRFNFIKSFVTLKVRLLFNPPVSSFALNEMTKEVDELEWRIRSEVACYGK